MDRLGFPNEHDVGTNQGEERLLALMKATSDVIYRMSPDWKTMTELYGRGFLADTEDSDPRWFEKYIHPDDQEFVLSAINDCIIAKKMFELEHRVFKADGSIGWTFSRAIPLFDEKGEIKEWFGAASDVTERKQAEEALIRRTEELESKEREYLEIIDSSSEGSYIHDINKGEIYFSSEWKNKLGISNLSPAQAAKTFLSLVHPDDLKGMQSVYEDACRRRLTKVRMEFRAKTSEGYIWILGQEKIIYNNEGRPVKYFGTHIDITGRKKMEEDISFQVHLLSVASEATAAIDCNHRIVYWNEAAEKLYGIKSEEALGQPAGIIAVEVPGTTYEDAYGYMIRDGCWHGEAVYRRRDGTSVWVEAHTKVLRNEKGELTGTVTSSKDVTERKQAELSLCEKTMQLNEANRQKDDILGSISDCFYALDGELRFTYANKAAEEVWGISRSELIGRKIEDVFPGLIDISMSKFRQVLEDKIPLYYEVFSKVIERWGIMSVYPTKEGVSVYFRDISEQKRAEQALAAERQRFFDVLETLPVMVCLISPDYHIPFVNKAFREKFGEVEGRCCFDYCCGYKEPCPFCESLLPLKTGRPHHWEFTSPDGNTMIDAHDLPFSDTDGSPLILEMDIDITERRRAEEALREATREAEKNALILGAVVKQMPAGVIITNGDGSEARNNDEMDRIWRRNMQDKENIHSHEYVAFHPDGTYYAYDEWPLSRSLLAGETVLGEEMNILRGDGTVGTVLVSSAPVRDGEGKTIAGVVVDADITKLRQAEEALREITDKEAFLLKLSDAIRQLEDPCEIQDAVARLVGEHMGVDRAGYGEVVREGGVEFFRIERDYHIAGMPDLCGINFPVAAYGHAVVDTIRNAQTLAVADIETDKRFAPEERDAYRAVSIRAVVNVPLVKEGRCVANFGVQQRNPREWTRGELMLLEETVARTWAAVERAKTEEALRISEQKYREIIKYAPAGIYELDFRNDRFISVNDVMCELTGYTREEFLNMSPSVLLDGEGKKLFKSRLDSWLGGKAPEPNADYRIITKDGREIYVSLNTSFTKDDYGRPLGATVIGHDVTERRKMEETLQRSEKKALELVKELEEADRNKNQFIGVLSHELRNPLAAISAGVQILDITKDMSQTAKAEEIIKRQTNHLCKLVDDLLELTRITQNKIKLKKENISLNAIVKGAVEDIRPEYKKKGLKLGTVIQTKPVLMNADPVRIMQIVGNLLMNALKFTQTGGAVYMTLKTEKNYAVLSVKDNGIGISPEVLPHLFMPFTQAENALDRSGGGLGLGLSIVKGIVDLHEGNVSAFSGGLGKGSTFTIRLPITTEDNTTMDKTTTCDNDRKSLKLLIIEDNRDFADLLSAMLNSAGYQVEISYGGFEGLEKARQFRPDIIFCDIGLPGMDGFEVAKAIKEDSDLKDAYLVALTGYAGAEDLKRAKESGFDRHMAKPVSLAALKRLLNEY